MRASRPARYQLGKDNLHGFTRIFTDTALWFWARVVEIISENNHQLPYPCASVRSVWIVAPLVGASRE